MKKGRAIKIMMALPFFIVFIASGQSGTSVVMKTYYVINNPNSI